MKLYLSPGSCSLSPHIALREADLPFELERVDLKTKTTASGENYRAINPMGSVPALKLDDGQVLTEGPAIVQYIADQKPEAKLAPPPGTMARYRLAECLNFVSTEVHKAFAPLFWSKEPAVQDLFRGKLANAFTNVEEKRLAHTPYLCGTEYSVGDIYFYALVNRWPQVHQIDMSRWPRIRDLVARMAERPTVKAAHAAEAALRN
jgi:glutathione S-transferase